MNKTFLNLDYKISVLIVSFFGIILGFLSNAFYVDSIIEMVLYVFRFLLFIGIYLLMFFIEKKNLEFKESLKRMSGYLLVSSILNVVFALFSLTHILVSVFLFMSGVLCLWVIVSFLLEIIYVYKINNNIKNIVNVNKKIGLILISPIIEKIEKGITND